MFKMLAIVCFMQVGIQKQDLCFPSEVPLRFHTKEECRHTMNYLADYMNNDLKERNTAITFICKKEKHSINL